MTVADDRFVPALPANVTAALRDLDAKLRAAYGDDFVGLRLFGSYARGEQHDESDVDVMILLARDGLPEKPIFDAAAEVDVAHGLWISSLILSKRRYASMLEDEYQLALDIHAEGMNVAEPKDDAVTRSGRKRAAEQQLVKGARALRQAEVLLEAKEYEGAASRAYYCAFHAVRAALAMEGVQPRTHRGASERMNIDLVEPGKIEASYLSAFGVLQTHRELADYAVDAEVSAEQATADVASARRLIERMRALVDA